MYVSVTKMHAAPQGPRQPRPSVPGPCVVAAVVRAARSAVACTPFSRGASAQFTASVCSQGKLPSVT